MAVSVPVILDRAQWLMAWRATPDVRLRLFCFPYAGAGPSMFRWWPAGLPASVDVIGIQLPGREGRFREPCLTRMEDLIPPLAEAVHPFLDRPFALFGHSMGALAGFELARHLRRTGGPAPARLIVSAMGAPHVPSVAPPISHLPDAAFCAEVQRRYHGIPDEILREPELLDLLLPVLRSDIRLIERYRCAPDAPLGAPITALGGDQDPWSQPERLDPWRAHTVGGLTIRMYPGGHFFINTSPGPILKHLGEVCSIGSVGEVKD
ncbi:MAG: thioesterase II family protein [Chloroflexota bacterium]